MLIVNVWESLGNYTPLFNESTSISANLDESEAMKFSNLDVIIVTWIHHAHNHFEMYSKLKILRKAQFAKCYCINNHELLETYMNSLEIFWGIHLEKELEEIIALLEELASVWYEEPSAISSRPWNNLYYSIYTTMYKWFDSRSSIKDLKLVQRSLIGTNWARFEGA